jgi:hypothetical protein
MYCNFLLTNLGHKLSPPGLNTLSDAYMGQGAKPIMILWSVYVSTKRRRMSKAILVRVTVPQEARQPAGGLVGPTTLFTGWGPSCADVAAQFPQQENLAHHVLPVLLLSLSLSLSNSIPQFPIRRRRSHRSTATACSARIRRKRCEPRLLRRVARSSARAPAPPRACSPRDAASHGEADLGRRELFGGPSARIVRRPAAGWPPMTPRREADGWI